MQKCLIFDFDNTLANNTGTADNGILNIIEGFLQISKANESLAFVDNFTSDYQVCKYFLKGSDLEEAYRLILKVNKEKVQNVIYSKNLINALKDLYQKYTLFVLSGRDNASLTHSLEIVGIQSLFKEIIGDDVTLQPKPHPISLNNLIKRNNLKPQHCIYIGDKDSDFHFAKAACCGFIASAWYKNRIVLPCTSICHDPRDLPSIIEKEFLCQIDP